MAGRFILIWNPTNADADLLDHRRVWFCSEETGYSHLYTVDMVSRQKQALTTGKFEIFEPFISRDRKKWYFTSSEAHPGERHFYSMPIAGGAAHK